MRLLLLTAVILVAVGAEFSLSTAKTEAHPGNTDSSGCHTCRTNCTERWGISYGFYHRHNPVRPCFEGPLETPKPIPTIRPITPTPPPNQVPSVSLEIPDPVEEDNEARFRAYADDTDGSIIGYEWDYGDGTTETTDSPYGSHTFSSPGRYTVTVAAVDDDGASKSATDYFTVEARKWPLSRELMTWIVIGGVVGLFVLSGVIASIIYARRSVR